MPNTQLKTERNQSMEICKLIASIFVVFIHVRFPGNLGGIMDCLARFAVPLFFGISGYFSFRAKTGKLGKRIVHILELNVAASLLYIAWRWLVTAYYGGSVTDCFSSVIPGGESLVQWLLVSANPFAGHLWYLTAIGVCYGILWLYVRFFGEKPVDYRPLYIVSVCLFTVHFIMGEMAKAVDAEVLFLLYRNALLFGLPMFTLGIFLREYQERIFANFRLTSGKLVTLIAAGIVLSLLQWKGTGIGEMPLGTLVEVMALMLLLATHPKGTSSAIAQVVISMLGRMSTTVYIVHLLLIEAYEMFLMEKGISALGTAEGYLRPLIVVFLSLAAAILWEFLHGLAGRFQK